MKAFDPEKHRSHRIALCIVLVCVCVYVIWYALMISQDIP